MNENNTQLERLAFLERMYDGPIPADELAFAKLLPINPAERKHAGDKHEERKAIAIAVNITSAESSRDTNQET